MPASIWWGHLRPDKNFTAPFANEETTEYASVAVITALTGRVTEADRADVGDRFHFVGRRSNL